MAARRSTDRLSGMIRITRQPRIAATMASAMPVSPLWRLRSTYRRLDFAARLGVADHGQGGRSSTEPAGLLPSSLARMTLPRAALSGIRGCAAGGPAAVLPMVCSTVG